MNFDMFFREVHRGLRESTQYQFMERKAFLERYMMELRGRDPEAYLIHSNVLLKDPTLLLEYVKVSDLDRDLMRDLISYLVVFAQNGLLPEIMHPAHIRGSTRIYEEVLGTLKR